MVGSQIVSAVDDLKPGIVRSPHGLMHLLDRIVHTHLRHPVLDGGQGDGHSDFGGDPTQIRHRRQQGGSWSGGIAQLRDGIRRRGNHAVRDPARPRYGHAQTQAGKDERIVRPDPTSAQPATSVAGRA
jgi:hypothetical protein